MALISEGKSVDSTDWTLLAPTGQHTVSVSLNGTGRALIKAVESGTDPGDGEGGHIIAWNTPGTPSAVAFNGMPDDCEVYGKGFGSGATALAVTSW